MNRDVCVVPTFRRPEFLWVCLEHLEQCAGVADLQIVVAVDNHQGRSYDPQILEVARRFAARLNLSVTVRAPHGYEGNSYNVLTALQEALKSGAQYVFLVEDDIMVLPDYFRWNYAVQAAETGMFASIASLNKHVAGWPQRGEPAAYFTSKVYTSHGVCLPAASLAMLTEYSCPAYFAHMPGYILRRFPRSEVGKGWTEQDGLIWRILLERGLRTAWPCAARAFHTGFWGYHRSAKTRIAGALEKKVEGLRKVMGDTPALLSLSPYFADLDGITGPLAPWDKLARVAEL